MEVKKELNKRIPHTRNEFVFLENEIKNVNIKEAFKQAVRAVEWCNENNK